MTEREFAVSVVRRLHEAGHQALWAGGCVRDELLGLAPRDYDVATSAPPDDVKKLFRHHVAVGESFGVIMVLGARRGQGEIQQVEVATFRNDGEYIDGRHPEVVVYSSAREDALRRDFTINGMFFDPLKSELIDFVGGQEDLHARVLRAIGDPAIRFREDKLRLLRAVRIATRFELAVEPATAAAIRAMADQINVVSAERIAKELRELLVHPRRVRGLNLLFELGLLEPILPELLPMKGLPQGPPRQPTGDLWDHVLWVMDLLGPAPSFPLALATLLHDVGKPRTVGRTPERYTFHSHEHVGARLAGDLCRRLKLSNDERMRVVWLVERHQYLADAHRLRPSKLKAILVDPGIHELLALHRADALASGRDIEHVEYCERLLREWTADDLFPAPLLTGGDLKRHGLQPSPLFKRLLDAVREAQLDGTIRTTPEAWELVERLRREEGDGESEAAGGR
jgi:poly(A) polymerase